MLFLLPLIFAAEAPTPAVRRDAAMAFHLRASERTGVLVPMYVYPADVHKNPVYNRLIDVKRRHETVPIWVIVNPTSGPGKAVDANYTKAIDRLRGGAASSWGTSRRTTASAPKRMWPKTSTTGGSSTRRRRACSSTR